MSPEYQQIIAFDLDGTAIRSAPDARPSYRLKEVVTALQNAGNIMTPVTSRPLAYCRDVVSDFELEGLAVVAGGAQIYDSARDELLDDEDCGQELLKDENNILYPSLIKAAGNIACFAGDTTFSENELVQLKDIDFRKGTSGIYFLDIQEEQLAKDIVYEMRRLQGHELFPVQSVYIDTMLSGNGFDVHILSSQSTKGNGLKKVARYYDADLENIIACGDGWNDMSMLLLAGTKVVMANADPRIKATLGNKAKYIGSVEEDGLAEYFEQLLAIDTTC